jgi:riboflavin synthase
MFTGIIEEIGTIKSVTANAEGKRFRITACKVLEDLHIGDSIAVDGVCLTAEEFGPDYFDAQAVGETLSRSTLNGIQRGDKVNLERAMAAGGRFGGHFVQGHVDAVATITSLKNTGNSAELGLTIPDSIQKYIVEKGSLTVNGVSLTVASVEGNEVRIALIPATLKNTTLGFKKAGETLNVEVDVLAKYIEKMLGQDKKEPLTFERVKNWGFNQ